MRAPSQGRSLKGNRGNVVQFLPSVTDLPAMRLLCIATTMPRRLPGKSLLYAWGKSLSKGCCQFRQKSFTTPREIPSNGENPAWRRPPRRQSFALLPKWQGGNRPFRERPILQAEKQLSSPATPPSCATGVPPAPDACLCSGIIANDTSALEEKRRGRDACAIRRGLLIDPRQPPLLGDRLLPRPWFGRLRVVEPPTVGRRWHADEWLRGPF